MKLEGYLQMTFFLGFGHYLVEDGISPADIGTSMKHKLYTEASRNRDHPRNGNV